MSNGTRRTPPASRPPGGESKQDLIYHDLIMIPALAAERFAINSKPNLLACIAGDWLRIVAVHPTSRMNKLIVDQLFEDTDGLIGALWKKADGAKS